MPVGLSRGDYFVEQAIQSRYTYCLICHQHIDATPVVWYTLGDDHIFLHEWCAARLMENLAGDLALIASRLPGLTVETHVHLDHVLTLLQSAHARPQQALPSAETVVVDADED